MANFTSIALELNTGTQTAPVWTAASTEVRWSDQGNLTATGASTWPAMLAPSSPTVVSYTYCFTADTAGSGVPGGASPLAFANANFNFCRWNWDATGTFASAPIVTGYYSSGHAAITRGDNQLLGGNSTDTGSTPRSYLKGNWFGNGTSQVPTSVPANPPGAGDGATGPLVPATSAWLANYQSLQGDNDYIQCGGTPPAKTANQWYGIFALFAGPNLNPGTYTPVISLKYTWL